MDTADLIGKFAHRTSLPIDVNELLPILAENGEHTDIQFIGVDLNPDILQGKIKIFHLRNGVYAEPERCANIYYHRGLGSDWQRFICCKELLHLVDPKSAHTSSSDEIDDLAASIGLPEYMQDPLADGFAANIDRLAEFRAVAILLPFAVREVLLQPVRDERLTLEDVAKMADIPRKYVGLVMSDHWAKIHEMFLQKVGG